jgi:hypothetical protein
VNPVPTIIRDNRKHSVIGELKINRILRGVNRTVEKEDVMENEGRDTKEIGN